VIQCRVSGCHEGGFLRGRCATKIYPWNVTGISAEMPTGISSYFFAETDLLASTRGMPSPFQMVGGASSTLLPAGSRTYRERPPSGQATSASIATPHFSRCLCQTCTSSSGMTNARGRARRHHVAGISRRSAMKRRVRKG
jgi:hypothetical protein